MTPNAVDKLNYAQLYPIVIFVKTDNKQTIKDCRANLPKKAHLPSRKLLEQCQKLDKMWSHIFTSIVDLDAGSNEAIWYAKTTDIIEKQQTSPVWMSDTKVIFQHFENNTVFENYCKKSNIVKIIIIKVNKIIEFSRQKSFLNFFLSI